MFFFWQSHAKWDCKYHVVIVPKYRQRLFFGRRKKQIGAILRELCRQKEIGYLKGKSPLRIHRELMKTQGTLFGCSFWSRGYCVSTVGLHEMTIRRYMQEQSKHERD